MLPSMSHVRCTTRPIRAGSSADGHPVQPDDEDFPVEAIDYVHFAVGNAKQAAHYYSTAFGMRVTAYRGPETGPPRPRRVRPRVRRGAVPAHRRGPRRHRHRPARPDHGDGVIDVAIRVPDAAHAYELAVAARRDRRRRSPTVERGRARQGRRRARSRRTARPATRSSSARDYSGVFLPGFVARDRRSSPRPTTVVQAIDHVVGNVELGHMDEWVGFYNRDHGLHEHEGVRRRRHRHRVLRADEQGRRRRQPQREVPAQRAGPRQEEEPDRRVPRVLRRPWRPAHRAGDRRHRPHRRAR